MSGRIDLHIHTTASDGTFSPSEAVAHAHALGLRAIAVTDHDTAAGTSEGLEAGRSLGVEVVPGIELTVDWHGFGVHILGYFIDPAAPELQALLDWVIAEREARNETIAAALRADGIRADIGEMRSRWPGAILGRPHFAQLLVEQGLAGDVTEAFDRYLSIGERYFRKREYIPMDMAFSALRAAGGKPVFAHPFQYPLEEEGLLTLASDLKEAGIVGMECFFGDYTREQTGYLLSLAAQMELCVTGGSDFHGTRRHIEMGTPEVPYALLERLKMA